MSRSAPTVKQREPISGPDRVMTFGKYKGESIADILDCDPQYLVWLHNNNEFFELDHALLEAAEEGR